MAADLALNGNRVVDMVLINMRRTLLQTRREVLELPPLHATFMHKIGSISFVGKFETEAGWLKNLATINRVSDVSVSHHGDDRTSFSVTLKIKDLQVNGHARYWSGTPEWCRGSGANLDPGGKCSPRGARPHCAAHTRAAHRTHRAATVGPAACKPVHVAHISFPRPHIRSLSPLCVYGK
ncbi:hypothetical protein RR48_12328 [Papilio machaon]|uniref:Uncharacterized protein n=1 Tax=Papilio machaon TaxID=76193 RepID=A0A194QUB9_PAPMA|nr:hypothetical protein RR48_12328 [Papilio machaon]